MKSRIGFVLILLLAATGAIHADNSRFQVLGLDHTNFRDSELLHEPIDFDNIDYERVNAAIFLVTNEVRVKFQLPPLGYKKELEVAAFEHSRQMVLRNFFDHQDSGNPGFKSPQDRATQAGISNPYIGENIANHFGIQYQSGTGLRPLDKEAGTFKYSGRDEIIPPHTYLSLAITLVNEWMNSAGHRANILAREAVELGCGAYFYRDKGFYNMPKFKATQNFQFHQPVRTSGEGNGS